MFPKPAHSVQKFLPLFSRQKNKIVLDYGSGNLRNSLFLHRKGYTVIAVDLPNKIKLNSIPNLKFVWPEDLKNSRMKINVAICTFVLNLLEPSERVETLDRIAKNMEPGGYLLIETKGISLPELDRLVIPKGFIRIHLEHGRYTIIVLYQYIGPGG